MLLHRKHSCVGISCRGPCRRSSCGWSPPHACRRVTWSFCNWWCRRSPEPCGDPRRGPLSRWWIQIDCSGGTTRLSAAVRIGSSSAVRIGAPAVRPWGVDCTGRALMSSLPRVLRFTRTCQARRWPSARLLPRPSRRSLRKLRDRTSVGPSSFGRGRCVGLVLTRNLVQYNYSSLVWLHADRLHQNQNTDRELIYF